MDSKVRWSVPHSGPDSFQQFMDGWIAMKFNTIIHNPQGMIANDFGEPVTFSCHTNTSSE